MKRHGVEFAIALLATLMIGDLAASALAAQRGGDASAIVWVPPGSQPEPNPMQYGPPPPPADQPAAPQQPAQEQPAGVNALTSGPVNEAFAEPVPLAPQAGLIVTQRPPDPVAESAPAMRPAGENVVWIPGYWAWEADQNDFVWVSGCWRVPPPGMSWVPGYWATVFENGGRNVDVGVGPVGVHVGGGVNVHIPGIDVNVGGQGPPPGQITGWEWVPGFWSPATAQEIEYLPDPPPAADVQPPGPAPSPDVVWVPGCSYWVDGRYVPRAGYWLTCQNGWTWVASSYLWTPRGYVFCAGHWDYSLDRRGLLFAPVRFDAGVIAAAGFAYSPSIVVDLGGLEANLFACPRYSHYFFGDYYDNSFAGDGIYPCFDAERMHTWYDPVYTYDRWRVGKNNSQWDERMQQDFNARRADKQLRPPRTFAELQKRRTGLAALPAAQQKALNMASPLSTIAASATSPIKLAPLSATDKKQLTEHAAATHAFRDNRVKWESQSASAAAAAAAKTGPPSGGTNPPAGSKVLATPRMEGKGPAGVVETPQPHTTFSAKPEKVKIPSSPIINNTPAAGQGEQAPPPPANETKHQDSKGAEKEKEHH